MNIAMTTAHPLAPPDKKKINKIKKQQQTDPQGEEKWEKQHRINQCMKTFFFQEGTVTIYTTINLFMN